MAPGASNASSEESGFFKNPETPSRLMSSACGTQTGQRCRHWRRLAKSNCQKSLSRLAPTAPAVRSQSRVFPVNDFVIASGRTGGRLRLTGAFASSPRKPSCAATFDVQKRSSILAFIGGHVAAQKAARPLRILHSCKGGLSISSNSQEFAILCSTCGPHP